MFVRDSFANVSFPRPVPHCRLIIALSLPSVSSSRLPSLKVWSFLKIIVQISPRVDSAKMFLSSLHKKEVLGYVLPFSTGSLFIRNWAHSVDRPRCHAPKIKFYNLVWASTLPNSCLCRSMMTRSTLRRRVKTLRRNWGRGRSISNTFVRDMRPTWDRALSKRRVLLEKQRERGQTWLLTILMEGSFPLENHRQ